MNKYLAKRKLLEMTQQQLADAIGVAVSTVKRWENGVSVPSYDPFERLNASKGSTQGSATIAPPLLTWKTWRERGKLFPEIYKKFGSNSHTYTGYHPREIWNMDPPIVFAPRLPFRPPTDTRLPIPEHFKGVHVIPKDDGSWQPLLSILDTKEYSEAAAAVRIIPENTELNRKIAESIKNGS